MISWELRYKLLKEDALLLKELNGDLKCCGNCIGYETDPEYCPFHTIIFDNDGPHRSCGSWKWDGLTSDKRYIGSDSDLTKKEREITDG